MTTPFPTHRRHANILHAFPALRQGEPRWPALVAMLSVSALFYAIPPALQFGPDWLFVVLVLVPTAPGVCLRHQTYRNLMRYLGYFAGSVMTLAMIGSLSLLISRLPLHKESPAELLRAATACGSPTFWYSRRGTGAWMRAAHFSAISSGPTPTVLFCFPK